MKRVVAVALVLVVTATFSMAVGVGVATAVPTGHFDSATDGPTCARDYYDAGGRTTKVQDASFTASRRPIVYVHGWVGNSSMWSDDFNFKGELEAQLGNPPRTQNFVYDYSELGTSWANDPNIAACLGQYITEIGEAYRAVGGDGKVIAVAHSMGGLALLYSSSSEFAQYPSGDHLRAIVTLDTPYLGSYQGGDKFSSLGNLVGKYQEVKSAISKRQLLPPLDSDALICLNVHSDGRQIPSPCNQPLPPLLPASVSLTQVVGNITVHRSIFGVHVYDLPLGSDGVVPVDSQRGYLQMYPKAVTGQRVDIQQVDCSVSTGQLQEVSQDRTVGDLVRNIKGSVVSVAGMLSSVADVFNDANTFNDITHMTQLNAADASRFNSMAVTSILANLKAECSHINTYHYQSTLNKVTEVIKEYLDQPSLPGIEQTTASFLREWKDKDAEGMRQYVSPSAIQRSGRSIPENLITFTPTEAKFDCRSTDNGYGCYISVAELQTSLYLTWTKDEQRGWTVVGYVPDA